MDEEFSPYGGSNLRRDHVHDHRSTHARDHDHVLHNRKCVRLLPCQLLFHLQLRL